MDKVQPLRIALIGYGKMGKEIEQICIKRGHTIHLIADHENPLEKNLAALKSANVAIEFSEPGSAFSNVTLCAKSGVPVICGTTGWNEKLEEAKQIVNDNSTALLWSSNFSIGVNLFFEINKQLARLMNSYPAYVPEISETHHVHKKDAPSGTAITTAEGIISNVDSLDSWKGRMNTDENTSIGSNFLPIISFREDEVPGTHEVVYRSEVDEIKLSHVAFSRQGFALGAVIAAEWIIGKKGIFAIQNILEK
jgi:4-hydroxy-tetrahydrodipicolinate reductase